MVLQKSFMVVFPQCPNVSLHYYMKIKFCRILRRKFSSKLTYTYAEQKTDISTFTCNHGPKLLRNLKNYIIFTVCSYHVTYAHQSESTLYSCLNFKELLARSRREIWSLSDCNWTQTQNHLVRKRTLNHLAKLECSFTN